MPWWSWILIWSGLGLALLALLALFGVNLFRKVMTLANAVGAIGTRVSAATAQPDEPAAVTTRLPAIFDSRDRLAEVIADRRFGRLQHRQLRRDRAIHRGKLFGTFPAIPKDSSHA